MSEHRIEVRINGQLVTDNVEARWSLADFLRIRAGLTGTHVGCEHGVCGACTVLVDGEPVRSCLMFAVQADHAEVTTIEGLARPDGSWHPVQEAMREGYALQCGFCTPGIAITLASLLEKGRQDKASMMAALSGHICRCTGYQGIRRAIDILASDTQTETAS